MSEALDTVRRRIEALGMDFQFMKAIHTGMNGIERETWLLEYQGSQFVYVAGQKNVVLGWDVQQCPLGEGVLECLREECALGQDYYQDTMEDLKEYYQKQMEKAAGNTEKIEELRQNLAEELQNYEEEQKESGCTGWEDFLAKWNEKLSQCLSPLRTADIGDMLVEVDSRYIEEDLHSLPQAVELLKAGPFTLATEDEWEYLCNGGARTLYRWGDALSEVRDEIYNVGAVSNRQEIEGSILERPNMLGLFLAYDSYRMEIIDNIEYTKGGDGGCSLCGGDGPIHVLPCYSAFYREAAHNLGSLSKNYYCYRRIIRLP